MADSCTRRAILHQPSNPALRSAPLGRPWLTHRLCPLPTPQVLQLPHLWLAHRQPGSASGR
eukprot:scaffold64590_cov61-Phaeocystis_antarctica.AAC.1